MSQSNHSTVKNKKKRRAAVSYTAQHLQEPSYLPDVIKKVQKHNEFKELPENEARKKAIELTDDKQLHYYFSHLTDISYETQVTQIREEAEQVGYGRDLLSTTEIHNAQSRATIQFDRAATMPIKLQLTELNRENLPPKFLMDRFTKIFALKYGPLHAALVIDDVTVEWNNSSLVVPRFGRIEPDLETDIAKSTAAMKSITSKEVAMKTAIDSLNYYDQMELVFSVTSSRAKLIEALIQVITKYNRFHTYDLLRCNCQTFVVDAMKEMGIDKPPKMTGRLKEYFKELRKGKNKAPDDFQTHEELDRYIHDSKHTGEFHHLTQHDKEFLLCLYFKFHLEALEENGDEECKVDGCKKGELEQAIDTPIILEEYCRD